MLLSDGLCSTGSKFQSPATEPSNYKFCTWCLPKHTIGPTFLPMLIRAGEKNLIFQVSMSLSLSPRFLSYFTSTRKGRKLFSLQKRKTVFIRTLCIFFYLALNTFNRKHLSGGFKNQGLRSIYLIPMKFQVFKAYNLIQLGWFSQGQQQKARAPDKNLFLPTVD